MLQNGQGQYFTTDRQKGHKRQLRKTDSEILHSILPQYCFLESNFPGVEHAVNNPKLSSNFPYLHEVKLLCLHPQAHFRATPRPQWDRDADRQELGAVMTQAVFDLEGQHNGTQDMKPQTWIQVPGSPADYCFITSNANILITTFPPVNGE